MSNKKLRLGSVSSGTMREEDVWEAIIDYLIEYRSGLVTKLTMQQTASAGDFAYLVWETAFDVMNNIAPKGYYFGAHPDDGCDYGFWQCEEK